MNEGKEGPDKTVNVSKPKRSFLKRFWWVLLVLVILIPAIFFGNNVWQDKKFLASKDDIFITSMPVDLSQISRISPFRSCMGHDYSALNINGEDERTRSMKHYVQPLSKYNETVDKVYLYAPFDGKVALIDGSKEALKSADQRFGGKGFAVYPKSSSMWTLEFGHVYPLDNLKTGSEIKSGQLIGYAYVQEGGSSFDLALWLDRKYSRGFSGDDHTTTLDSIFNHMSPDVLRELSKYKVTKDDLIITKEFRDANVCHEVDGGVNAKGEKEVVFTQVEGDAGLMVDINIDPDLIKKDGKK